MDVKIYIFGVTPPAGESRQSKAAAEHKGDAGGSQHGDGGAINRPFSFRNRVGPTKIRNAPWKGGF